jgi:hypothetical protein
MAAGNNDAGEAIPKIGSTRAKTTIGGRHHPRSKPMETKTYG